MNTQYKACAVKKASDFDSLNVGCRRSYKNTVNPSKASIVLEMLVKLYFETHMTRLACVMSGDYKYLGMWFYDNSSTYGSPADMKEVLSGNCDNAYDDEGIGAYALQCCNEQMWYNKHMVFDYIRAQGISVSMGEVSAALKSLAKQNKVYSQPSWELTYTKKSHGEGKMEEKEFAYALNPDIISKGARKIAA